MAEYRLNPGESKQHPVEHRYLRVSFASAPFEISARTMAAFEVKNREFIDMERGGEIVTLSNRSDSLVVVNVDSVPRRISGVDEVNLAAGASVTLAPGSQLDVGEVNMAPDAELSIKAGSSVEVSNFPADQAVTVNNFPADQAVTVSNPQTSVEVSNFPANQTVTVSNPQTSVEVNVAGSFSGMPRVEFSSGSETVAANASRKELHMKAASDNEGFIWVGSAVADAGIPLSPGQSAVIASKGAVDLFADSGAIVYLAEVV